MRDRASILITGLPGFIASHTLKYCEEKFPDANIIGTYKRNPPENKGYNTYLAPLDVTDKKAFKETVNKYQPVKIFHFAGQSSPVKAFENFDYTVQVNHGGTENLLESIKAIREKNKNYNPIVVVASSGAVYGGTAKKNIPVKEDLFLHPVQPYGMSKMLQDSIAESYFIMHGIKTIRARIFNTTGSGKTGDVVNDFIQRAFEIKEGRRNKLLCGNLDSKRAILDIRDLVNALVLLSDKGTAGEAYNICSETLTRTGDIIPILENILGIKIETETDPTLLRPVDEPVVYGDVTKLKAATGWGQQYSLGDTIREILQDLNLLNKRIKLN